MPLLSCVRFLVLKMWNDHFAQALAHFIGDDVRGHQFTAGFFAVGIAQLDDAFDRLKRDQFSVFHVSSFLSYIVISVSSDVGIRWYSGCP